MFKQFPKRTSAVVALIAFAVQILVFAPSVSAKWHDQSDELDSGGDSTVLIIVGVVAVGVLIYVLAKKHGGDKTEEGTKGDDSEESSQLPRGSESLATVADISGELPTLSPMGDSPRLNYYLAMKNRQYEFGRELPDAGLANVTLEVGLSFGL